MIVDTSLKVVAIVEARMRSSRLPGKHLLLANGRPMLQHLIDRLKTVSSIDVIVIATTINDDDDVIADLAGSLGVEIYRGSELDVMGRVLEAAEVFGADVVCEVTGDCPIIDPELIEQAIQTYLKNNAVYVNNGRGGLPDGMGAQVFSYSALKQSAEMTKAPLDREHVTLHIRNNPVLFPAVYLVAPGSLNWPELGLTLDEESDYQFLMKIIETLAPTSPFFSCHEVINFLRGSPNLLEINKTVVRKGDS